MVAADLRLKRAAAEEAKAWVAAVVLKAAVALKEAAVAKGGGRKR